MRSTLTSQKDLKIRNTNIGLLYVLVLIATYALFQYRIVLADSQRPIVNPSVSVISYNSNSVDSSNLVVYKPTASPTPTPTPQIRETTEELIEYYSQVFSVNQKLVKCIIQNESGFDNLARGDCRSGSCRAVGLSQFWLSTYQRFRKFMGLSTKDERTDKAEAVKTLVWAIKNGYGKEWSVVRKGLCQ